MNDIVATFPSVIGHIARIRNMNENGTVNKSEVVFANQSCRQQAHPRVTVARCYFLCNMRNHMILTKNNIIQTHRIQRPIQYQWWNNRTKSVVVARHDQRRKKLKMLLGKL